MSPSEPGPNEPLELPTGQALALLDLMTFGDLRETQAAGAILEQAGDEIGPYRLTGRLGEGGFGIVWEAEQLQPIRRRVALKVIRPGMDSQSVLARFRAERRALERMAHPNIAAVLDAGTTPQGRPYFVMELVRGQPITRFCREAGLDLRQRLELFLDVCSAVQHAHQRAILHRDLKPSNILVATSEAGAVPKIIDFGIAKALSDEFAEPESLVQTLRGVVLGTPQYMAPEQALQGAGVVDVRVDVYALGAILYEMLTGVPPLTAGAGQTTSLSALLQRLDEVEPPRPSLCARQRQAAGESVPCAAEALRGDLDWILLKALEKNPEHRYASANALADDLRRHLAYEPVSAGPPDRWYRFCKLARRNRVAFAIGSVIGLNLLLLAGISTYAFLREQRAHGQAAAQSRKASALAGFLGRLLEQAGGFVNQGKNPEALTLAVNESLGEIDKLQDEPEVQAELLGRLADIYLAMGEFQRSLPLLQRQQALCLRLHGEASPVTLAVQLRMARATADTGDKQKAFGLYQQLERRWAALGPEYHDERDKARRYVARELARLGRRQEAAALASQVVAAVPGVPKSRVDALMFQADTLLEMEDWAGAETAIQEALKISAGSSGVSDFNRSLLMRTLSRLRAGQGRHEQAALAMEECIRLQVATRGGHYHGLIHRWIDASRLYLKGGRIEDAFRANDEAIAIARAQSNDQKLPRALRAAAEVREEAGHPQAALAYRRECMQIERQHNVDRGKWIYELSEIVRLESLLGLHEEAERDALLLWKHAQTEPAVYTDPPFLNSICKVLAAAGERWQAAGRQQHQETVQQWRSFASRTPAPVPAQP